MQAKILAVIAPERFRDEELFVPQAFLTEKGWDVTIASTKTGVATGMLGGTATATITIGQADASQYQALIVVGGYGSVEFLWENAELHELVNAFYKAGKVVSAICVSPVVLAKAGVLKGKNATVFEMPESLEAFVNAGVTYTGEGVTVTDKNLITAQSPEQADAFAQAVHTAVGQMQSAIY
jgi:protease I